MFDRIPTPYERARLRYEAARTVLVVILELYRANPTAVIFLKEIAARLAERPGLDFDRPMTPKRVGWIIRRYLNLKPYRGSRGFSLYFNHPAKLKALSERYGLPSREAGEADQDA